MAKIKKTRYKNDLFLKSLGQHCRQLRKQKGLSIDRLAKESDQLSTGTIDRLERGLADSQVLVLLRYAEVLGYSILDLFSFLKDNPELAIYKDPRIIPYEEGGKAPARHVPVYPLKVAAGRFGNSELTHESTPIGWVDASLKNDNSDYFAAFVRGQSMQPKINDGDLCLFKRYTGGSRQGHIFLIQARGLKNSETDESFVVKKYVRQTPGRQSEDDDMSIIHLVSENSKFPPIILMGASDDEIQVLAEFIRVIKA
ncbi:MAG: LexA family transcriptional regulator [Bdellovibrionaceae bacterium]|nr:LexA family transcriptional regulator [Pseudobdellovibrionaceae bacterium]